MEKGICRTVLLISAIGLIMTSCGKKETATEIIKVNGNPLYLVHADQVTDTIDLKLSDLIEDCEAVILEAKEQSYISRAHKIAVSDNYIAIKDSERTPLKLFTRDGKYLRDIGAIGRGPDEYNISLYGVQIDEEKEQLYLLPFANARKILVFGIDGQAKTHIPLRFQQRKFKAHVEGNIVTVLGMPFKNDSAVVFQQTIAGKLIQYLPPEDYHLAQEFSSEVNSSGNAGAYDIFQMIWSKTPKDSLYYYDTSKNKLVPQLTLDFETEEWPIYVCSDLPGHFSTWISGRGNVIVNKKTLETKYYKLVNDFYGGIKMGIHWDTARGMFISSISALNLKKEIDRCLVLDQSDKIRKKLMGLDARINENSNDVLFIGEYIQ